MISTNDRLNIARLIREIVDGLSTEELIQFCSNHAGMIESCEQLVAEQEKNNPQTAQWLTDECLQNGITHHQFIEHLSPVLGLFSISSTEDAYDILGVTHGSSIDEIKQAYRKLSRQYHPDTTTENKEDAVKKFMAISSAYRKITDSKSFNSSQKRSYSTSWRYKEKKQSNRKNTKKTVIAIGSLCSLLLFITLLAPNIYKNNLLSSRMSTESINDKPLIGKEPLQQSTAAPTPVSMDTIDTKVSSRSNQLNSDQLSMSSPPVEPQEITSKSLATKTVSDEKSEPSSLEVSSLPSLAPSIASSNSSEPQVVVADNSNKVDHVTDHHIQQASANSVIVPKRDDAVRDRTVMAHTGQTVSQSIPSQKLSTPPEKIKKIIAEKQKNTPVADKKATTQKKLITTRSKTTKQKQLQLVIVKEPEKDTSQAHKKRVIANKEPAPNRKSVTEEKLKLPLAQVIDTDKRVQAFLQEYIQLYTSKDLNRFSELFTPDATENEIPFNELKGDYEKLFNTTQSLALDISEVSWEDSENYTKISGAFHLTLYYPKLRVVQAKGNISFHLNNEDSSYKIKQFTYSFH